jgi:guanylate kinase
MKKRVILVGKSAAGKDHARKICQQWLGLSYQTSFTTRPPRWEETHGHDYYYIDKNEFESMIKHDVWYEYVMFNDWYYGTTREQFYTLNSVFVMTPAGLSHLSEKDREESLVIYLDIDEEIRRNRMWERGGNADSVDRRIEADRVDFFEFNNYDEKIEDYYYSILDIWLIVNKYMTVNSSLSMDSDGRLRIEKNVA